MFKKKVFTPMGNVYEEELKLLEERIELIVLEKKVVAVRNNRKLYQITIPLKQKEIFVLAMSDPYTCEIDDVGEYIFDSKEKKVYLCRIR